MCLDRGLLKTKRLAKSIETYNGLRIGYKIFTTDKEQLFSPYQTSKKPLKKKKWLDEIEYRSDKKRKTIRDHHGKNYRTGFHIFLHATDAKRFASDYYNMITNNINNGSHIHMVYFKDVTRYGVQDGSIVVVAKKMFIPNFKRVYKVPGYKNG